MLEYSCCTDHLVTNIEAFFGFLPFLLVDENLIVEDSRVVGMGYVRISNPKAKGLSKAKSRKFSVPEFSFETPISLKMHGMVKYLRFLEMKWLLKLQKGTQKILVKKKNCLTYTVVLSSVEDEIDEV